MRFTFALTVLSVLLGAQEATAQVGWITPLEQSAPDKLTALPKINLPKPEWSKVLDIKSSDGTASVPPCSDPVVVATVRDGIVRVANGAYRASGGRGDMVTGLAMGPVWVHPTYGDSYVCDMQVSLQTPIPTSPFELKFQSLAKDGNPEVFYYDVNGASGLH